MAGFAIKRPATAFSNAPAAGKKRPREKDKDHLAWLSSLPCVITGKRPVHVAHVRYADPVYGKPQTGMAEKPSDKWCVPLLATLHMGTPDSQHSQAERLFWARHGLDPLRLAAALYLATGDDEQGALIIAEANRAASAFKSILDVATTNSDIMEGDHE